MRLRHDRSGEMASLHVFLENYHKAARLALTTTERSLHELREAWQSIDWGSSDLHGQLERIHRVLGIVVHQLAQKDREMERYASLLHRRFAHHRRHLTEVHAAMDLIRHEVGREREVEYEARELHGALREEEQRLHHTLKQVAVALRRGNHADHEAISHAYHLLEPTLVRIEGHERKLLSALESLSSMDARAA